MEIRYIGQHQVVGQILDVNEERAAKLVELGECEYIKKPEKKVVKEVKEELPDKTWTEKKIKAWIKKENIPVKYDIVNDSKSDVFLRLKDGGYLK